MRSQLAIVLIQFIAISCVKCSNDVAPTSGSGSDLTKDKAKQSESASSNLDRSIGLEPRVSDRNFVKDILERLHALDADIGKLVYNSTSMYTPNDQNIAFKEQAGGGEKFSEVLNDLDSLQDEIGALVTNATRTRQYNILVRLRPLNGILYRIRHNLHLMRNSLVAISTVASLEKVGNSVLDSTLQAFMKPDANLHEEFGDDGNYEINLDRLDDLAKNSTTNTTRMLSNSPMTVATTLLTTPTSTTTSTSTTKPSTTTTTTITPATQLQSSTTTTKKPTQRTTQRRQSQRRTTKKPTTAPQNVTSSTVVY